MRSSNSLNDPCSSKMISFSNATEQPQYSVSSNYHHHACSDHPAVHNLGLSDTNLANPSSFTSFQGFRHSQLQEEPHSANNHKSESHACRWLDGHDLCGRTVDANDVPEHMCTYHLRSSERAGDPLYCQWEGCQRSVTPYRRDTIIRHVREVHLRISRPKSSASATHRRGSHKKAHIN